MERLHMVTPAGESFEAFLRRRASTNPSEHTWICPTCGTIAPGEIRPGLYVRRWCVCEEQRREAEALQAIRQQMQEEQRAQTFAWIGQQWVEPQLERLTFSSFDCAHHHQAFDQAQAFAHEPRGTLALTGNYGTGKTHLLVAIANARREANQPCLDTGIAPSF